MTMFDFTIGLRGGVRDYATEQQRRRDAERNRALSVAELVESIDQAATGGVPAGKIRGKLDRLGTSSLATRQRKLLGELAAGAYRRPIAKVPPPPWGMVHARPDHKRTPIGQADIEWLRMLPTDHTQITPHQAKELAAMLLDAEPGSGEARLIEQYFAPLRLAHERKVAAAQLAAAEATRSAAPHPIPATAIADLAATVQAETPTLTESEAVQRAQGLLVEVRGRQDATRAKAIAEARLAVAAVERGFTLSGSDVRPARPEANRGRLDRPPSSAGQASERDPLAGMRRLGE